MGKDLNDTGGGHSKNKGYSNCEVSGKWLAQDDMQHICAFDNDFYVQHKYTVHIAGRGNILKTDAIKLWDGRYVHKNDTNVVKCHGRGNIHAHVDHTFVCAIDGRHYLKDNHNSIKIAELDNITVHEKNVKKAYKIKVNLEKAKLVEKKMLYN